jgi:hypothetical protein
MHAEPLHRDLSRRRPRCAGGRRRPDAAARRRGGEFDGGRRLVVDERPVKRNTWIV